MNYKLLSTTQQRIRGSILTELDCKSFQGTFGWYNTGARFEFSLKHGFCRKVLNFNADNWEKCMEQDIW